MAKYLSLPKSLKEADKNFIQDTITATEEVFKGDLFGESNRPLTEPYTTADGMYHWTTNKDFFVYITDLTETGDIRSANSVLYKTLTTAPKFSEATMTGAPKYSAPSNTLTPEQLGQFQEEARVHQEKIEKIQVESKSVVEEAIKRQQEIYEKQIQEAKKAEVELKDKKIYYKIEENVPETQEIKDLKVQAEANPKRFIEDAAKEFEKKIDVKNLEEDEVDLISKQSAVTTYEVLTDNSPIVHAAIATHIISDPETPKALQEAASFLIDQKTAQFELGKHFINLAKIDGFAGIKDVKIEFSDGPREGYKEFNINQQIIETHIENLNQQNLLLDNLTDFGEGQIKSRFLSSASTKLANFIARQPVNSTLSKFYNSEIVQLGLGYAGLAPTVPWIVADGYWFGQIAVSSGLGPVAGFIQAKTGINLGVKLATKVGTEAAAKAGVATVAKTGFKAFFSKITAALGTAGGPIGTALAWLGGELLVKIASKIPWDKVKKIGPVIAGLVIGAPIALILGLPTGLLAGFGVFAGTTLLSGGLAGVSGALSGLGSGIVGFFGALGGATVGAIGIPILATLVGFPIVVVLILFIINSGAYVVPPSSYSILEENPYVGVVKEVEPSGPFENSDIPLTVTYTISVIAKKGPLTNISFKHECEIITENRTSPCPAPLPNTTPLEISPADPYIYTYTQTYSGSSYQDSLVINTFMVTADALENTGNTASGVASIIIGNPPTDCYNVAGTWPSKERATILAAISSLISGSPNYVARVCLAYSQVNLYYDPPKVCGAWGCAPGGNVIYFNSGGLGNTQNATYILAHESGHVLSYGSPNLYQAYLVFPGTLKELPVCTYGGSEPAEGFAEAIARKAVGSACLENETNNKSFVETYIFR